MIFEFEHPLLGLYLTSEQNFDYWTYFQLGFSFSFKVNTFSHRGKNFEEITPIHYVRPHEVRPYSRREGTLVSGYWRDGDGDTTINRQTGYYSRNHNAVSQIIRIGGKIL